MNYVILADSASDLTDAMGAVPSENILPLGYSMQGEILPDIKTAHPDLSGFYDTIRQGVSCTTSAVNIGQFIPVFESYLQQGLDILYLAFSSALSSTCQNGMAAAEELRAKYPERRIHVVDSLCACMGYGYLVYLTASGSFADVDEAAAFAEDAKLRVCHWFTVDNLKYLERGGRISRAAAIFGTALSIKPLMRMDNEGRLAYYDKTRGRKRALQWLADRLPRVRGENSGDTVWISHADCAEDAERLRELLRERGAGTVLIGDIGPVIGAHTGPGTIAVYFLAENRD